MVSTNGLNLIMQFKHTIKLLRPAIMRCLPELKQQEQSVPVFHPAAILGMPACI